tara:strand:- start:56 stop:640 length:585 start_codon:yes stop_codon:yes gene_type:complete
MGHVEVRMGRRFSNAETKARRDIVAAKLGSTEPGAELAPEVRNQLAKDFGVTPDQIKKDVQKILRDAKTEAIVRQAGNPAGDLVILPPAEAAPTYALMDDEARLLMRTAAIRLLRCAAAIDDQGVPYALDPKTSKDAAQALAILLGQVPDVLSLRANLDDEAATATLEIGGSDSGLVEALKALPPSYLKQAMGE